MSYRSTFSTLALLSIVCLFATSPLQARKHIVAAGDSIHAALDRAGPNDEIHLASAQFVYYTGLVLEGK